jgi:hypothetical protein
LKTSNKILQCQHCNPSLFLIQFVNENNTSGYTGVYFKKDVNKWTANIRLSGKSKHLGIFIDKKDAIACRKRADIKYGYRQAHYPTNGYFATTKFK